MNPPKSIVVNLPPDITGALAPHTDENGRISMSKAVDLIRQEGYSKCRGSS